MPLKNYQLDPVRKFLSSAWEARVEYNRLTEKIRTMEAQAMNTTATLSAAPGGGGISDTQRLWAALADETAKLKDKLSAALEREHEVEAFVERIDDPMYRMILKLRYVDCLSWPRVMELLSRGGIYYSQRNITRLHGEALEQARRQWIIEHEDKETTYGN